MAHAAMAGWGSGWNMILSIVHFIIANTAAISENLHHAGIYFLQ